MRRSTVTIIVILLIIVAAAAIAVGHKSNNNSSPTTSNTNSSTSGASGKQPMAGTINIRNMMFTPSQITVAKGGTVTWTNNDTTTHTVVDDLSNVDGPHSGDIPPGGKYSFTFNHTGSFQYHCTIHPSMRGTIVVK